MLKLFGFLLVFSLATWLAKFLYQGFKIRRWFRQLIAQGIPVVQPHSLLLGHLPIMKGLSTGLPDDAHFTYGNLKIYLNWRKYFPGEVKCPPVIYLDLWPFFPQPIVYINSPEACSQLTQEHTQPRHPMHRWALTPVTNGKDLISMACTDMAAHRLWRSRLNPGFSSRNLMLNMPALLEEVEIFVKLLINNIGHGGNWGVPFTLYDRAISLTFDVIARITLDLQLYEQTKGPGPLFQALSNLIPYSKVDSLWNRVERLLPKYRKTVFENRKVLHDTLLKQIEQNILSNTKGHKTIVDLALQEWQSESNNQDNRPSPQFIETVISQINFFLFAGHNTTAQTICWALYEVNRNPAVLTAVRAECEDVLGPDIRNAAETLGSKPYESNKLRYTNAVVRETLRVHNLSETFRQGSSDFKFNLDGTLFPTEGCLIQTDPSTLHIREDLWPRATEFLPERFIVQEGHPLYPVKNAWRPFEMGSMRCIGEELAMLEIALVLAFTVLELDVDFDREEWDELQKCTGPPDMVFGQRNYRCGEGVGRIKDDMPIRARLRKR
ncbi:cytochrome P450 [Daldinia sp. FL1419]|nr:cytochrome P450 [Daldinia sp. FL1419]